MNNNNYYIIYFKNYKNINMKISKKIIWIRENWKMLKKMSENKNNFIIKIKNS